MKRNRVLVYILTLAMALSSLTGCAASGGSAGSTGSTGSGTGSAVSSDGKGGEIIFWNNGTEDPDRLLWASAVDKFNAETDSGYTITVVATQNDNYKQKLTVAMSSGECPDVYQHWSGGPMIEYIKAGYAKPITELMEKDNFKDRFMDGALAQATYDGDIYAVPVLNCSLAGIFYNTEIYKKYNLSVPATISELEANCDILVKNGIVPFALANATSWTGSMYYMYLATRKGGLEPFNATVDGSGSFEADNFKYAGEKIQEWVDKGYFPKGVNGMDEDSGQSRQMIYKEQAAMELMGSWRIGNYLADSPEFHKKMGMFPFPAVDGSSADPSIVVGTIGDGFLSFNCTGDKLTAAFEAISYYSGDEGKKLFSDNGKLPPLKGVQSEDHLQQEVLKMLENASAVQLWYDQYLPPEVAEVHKSESQKLFDKSATPEQVNAAQQAAMQKYLAQSKS